MINLLLGAPGGGKSYEAVAFHVLPALNAGRRVITNLPLVLDEFPPEQRALLELRSHAKGKAERRSGLASVLGDSADDEIFTRPFSTVECYGDPWRHPDSGSGPLYVIDEAHMCLPREGTGRKVREWYAMHRHELADVLLITQSHGKVSKDIVDLVQVCYRVRKATAFGSNSGYVRKVLDGVRGEVVNTSVRKYDKRYFKFYKSHTKSSQAGAELAANDIVPLWKRWPFLGLGICVCLFLVLLGSGKQMNPLKPPQHQAKAIRSSSATPGQPVAPAAAPHSPAAARTEEHGDRGGAVPVPDRKAPQVAGPFAGLGVHLMGRVRLASGREVYSLVMSQNGQRIFSTNSDELVEAGYKVKRVSDCAMAYSYHDVEMVAVCDAPQVGVTPGEGVIADRPRPQVAEVSSSS
ncbi:zonular occludens toxin domain-containing protein [Cupriavidus pauculus]|jgi:zona occludens toxin